MTLNKKRIAILGVLATFFVAMMAGPASAAGFDDSAIPNAGQLGVSVNMFFVLIGAVLVIFMQAGFALVETGFCQSEARGARDVHELRHLRARLRRRSSSSASR